MTFWAKIKLVGYDTWDHYIKRFSPMKGEILAKG